MESTFYSENKHDKWLTNKAAKRSFKKKNVILGKIMGQSFIQAQLPPVSTGLPPKEEQQVYDPESIWKSLCAKMLFLKLFKYSNLFSFLV